MIFINKFIGGVGGSGGAVLRDRLFLTMLTPWQSNGL
jgi:hypothetical protein